jgi:hypothetical protein
MAAHDLEPGDELAPAMAERLAALASQHLPGMEASFVPPERVRAQIARGRAGVLASVARALDTTPVDEDLDQFLANHGIQVDAHQHKAMRMEGLRAAGEAWLTVAEREDELGKGWTAAPSAVTGPQDARARNLPSHPGRTRCPRSHKPAGLKPWTAAAPGLGKWLPQPPPRSWPRPPWRPRPPLRVVRPSTSWWPAGASPEVRRALRGPTRTRCGKPPPPNDLRAAELFLEFVGDIPAAALTEAHVQGFMQKLGQLPAGHGKAAAFRGLSAREAVAKADEHERMNPARRPFPASHGGPSTATSAR